MSSNTQISKAKRRAKEAPNKRNERKLNLQTRKNALVLQELARQE